MHFYHHLTVVALQRLYFTDDAVRFLAQRNAFPYSRGVSTIITAITTGERQLTRPPYLPLHPAPFPRSQNAARPTVSPKTKRGKRFTKQGDRWPTIPYAPQDPKLNTLQIKNQTQTAATADPEEIGTSTNKSWFTGGSTLLLMFSTRPRPSAAPNLTISATMLQARRRKKTRQQRTDFTIKTCCCMDDGRSVSEQSRHIIPGAQRTLPSSTTGARWRASLPGRMEDRLTGDATIRLSPSGGQT